MDMNLDPHLLRALIVVAETGTVSGAAERLARTQAAVSMQIKRLEVDLGTQLFKRTSRGVSLTDSGEILVAYARKLIALGEDARQQIEGRQLVGRVRLGLVEDLVVTRLPILLAEFRKRFPQIELDLVTAHSGELGQGLQSGNLDLVFADPARFTVVPFFHWSRQLVWSGSRMIDMGEGDAIPLIVFEGSCTWQDKTTVAFASAGVEWSVACRVSSYGALIGALRAGLGYSLMLPESIPSDCETLDSGGRLPKAPNADFGLFMAREPSKIVKELGFFLREKLVQ
ncbi:LysR family transcriptional regulator [Phyllobacterium myrsinacearum]|uniref:DNA-binding transcriptional LysR family regulator n=1 Tax=Phyllobacterium myrsinacearum TaxID=28101 RepID=A0A839ESZ4_9HYPH|nr:LysR family transcriptional regulator [Phyllobacterium myrsinacearum]MBA8881308.1 DNA-binding transcriptional LysR family regulator [Phyllobacterium myrsinacearum]